jgi:polar amino acid transport system substrate-binding protein
MLSSEKRIIKIAKWTHWINTAHSLGVRRFIKIGGTIRTISLLLCLIFVTVDVALSSDKSTSNVVQITTEEYPPFTTKNLKHYGLMSHIVTEAYLLEGIKVEYTFMPAARSFYTAEKGQADGTLPWAKRADREVNFFYSDPIFDVGSESFFFKKDSKFNWDSKVRDYSALKGLTIGAIISYDYGDEFRKAEENKVFDVIRVPRLKQLFLMLLNDRIDMLISKKLVANYTLQTEFTHKQAAQLDLSLENNAPPSYDYLLFSKKKSTAKYYLNALNRGLKKLHTSGKYDEFIENYKKGKYLNPKDE